MNEFNDNSSETNLLIGKGDTPPQSLHRYQDSIHSSNGSINSTSNGLVFGTSKAQPSVSATNTFTLSENPEYSSVDENDVVSNFRSLATGSKYNGAEMLSHRKSKKKQPKKHIRSISTSSNVGKTLPQLPATPKTPSRDLNGSEIITSPSSSSYLDYDKTLYVDEMYLDTQYRFATDKRNADFHALFPKVPEDDRLLDDFSCALSREILLQGRMYISEHYICFYSSLFGWVSNPTLVLSHDEITKFEKRSTAGLFPNGISIETKETTHMFASYLTRDSTLNFIETVWSKSLALSKLNNEKPRDVEIDGSILSNGGLSEQDIFTIDGDSIDSSQNNEYSSGDEEDLSLEGSKTAVDEQMPILDENNAFHSMKFPGPATHTPTENPVDYTKNNECIVLESVFDVPLGLLFKLYFGNDTSYHQKILELSDGSNFTAYNGLEKDKSRAFEFDKGLNYPVGPKSTRVYMEEFIENFDFEDYVEVCCISKTPNVPSGGVFDCRTRYVFVWDENNKTKLTVSFYLNWTGSSWIRSVIESSAKSGQEKAGIDIKTVLGGYIETRQQEKEQEQEKIAKVKRAKSKSVQKKEKANDRALEMEATKRIEASTNLMVDKLNTVSRWILLVLILEFIIILALGWNQYQLYQLIK